MRDSTAQGALMETIGAIIAFTKAFIAERATTMGVILMTPVIVGKAARWAWKSKRPARRAFIWCYVWSRRLKLWFFASLCFFVAAFLTWDAQRAAKDSHEKTIATNEEVMRSQRIQIDRQNQLLHQQSRGAVVKVDMADTEARAKIQQTEEKIRALEPIAQPISTLSVTVEMIVKTQQPRGGAIGNTPSAWVTFAKGSTEIATASTNQIEAWKLSDSTARIRIQAAVPNHAEIIGRSITALFDAEYLQIQILPIVIPGGEAFIERGTVVWILNNRTRIRFEIPPQPMAKRAVNPLTRFAFVGPLSEGFAELKAQAANR